METLTAPLGSPGVVDTAVPQLTDTPTPVTGEPAGEPVAPEKSKVERDFERLKIAHKTVTEKANALQAELAAKHTLTPTGDTDISKHPALKGYTLSDDGTVAYKNGDTTETPVDPQSLINQHTQAERINRLAESDRQRDEREAKEQITKSQEAYVTEVLGLTKDMVNAEFTDLPKELVTLAQENVETSVASFMRAVHESGATVSAEQVQGYINQQIAGQKAIGTAYASAQIEGNADFKTKYPAATQKPGVPGIPADKPLSQMNAQERRNAATKAGEFVAAQRG